MSGSYAKIDVHDLVRTPGQESAVGPAHVGDHRDPSTDVDGRAADRRRSHAVLDRSRNLTGVAAGELQDEQTLLSITGVDHAVVAQVIDAPVAPEPVPVAVGRVVVADFDGVGRVGQVHDVGTVRVVCDVGEIVFHQRVMNDGARHLEFGCKGDVGEIRDVPDLEVTSRHLVRRHAVRTRHVQPRVVRGRARVSVGGDGRGIGGVGNVDEAETSQAEGGRVGDAVDHIEVMDVVVVEDGELDGILGVCEGDDVHGVGRAGPTHVGDPVVRVDPQIVGGRELGSGVRRHVDWRQRVREIHDLHARPRAGSFRHDVRVVEVGLDVTPGRRRARQVEHLHRVRWIGRVHERRPGLVAVDRELHAVGRGVAPNVIDARVHADLLVKDEVQGSVLGRHWGGERREKDRARDRTYAEAHGAIRSLGKPLENRGGQIATIVALKCGRCRRVSGGALS